MTLPHENPELWNCKHGNTFGSCFHRLRESYECKYPAKCLFYISKPEKKRKKYKNRTKIRKIKEIISYEWRGRNHHLTALLECGHVVDVIFNKPYGMTLEEIQEKRKCKCKRCGNLVALKP